VTRKRLILAALSAVMTACSVYAAAQEQASSSSDSPPTQPSSPRPAASGKPNPVAAETASGKTSSSAAPAAGYDEASLRIEGEKRFRTNCGRCHMAPHKFPPRTMATVVRHMRVRAMITDEDMRLILRYLTQ
jgi:mono/diheme cytochrome c family protein